ncbi:hypothetical protein [Aliarcobacter butzleri]|uniref:hypothetical protein n=1 Tax=Aliarcobacter butzleri TaxID=28197 RepID=UPI002B254769|nr:hypothetical protein [Aliarcobacter butzleri]
MGKDENEKGLEELTISKGTIIHLNSIPFELSEDTKVLGLQSNLELAFSLNQDKDDFNQSVHSVSSRKVAQEREDPCASLTTSNLSFLSKQDDK